MRQDDALQLTFQIAARLGQTYQGQPVKVEVGRVLSGTHTDLSYGALVETRHKVVGIIGNVTDDRYFTVTGPGSTEQQSLDRLLEELFPGGNRKTEVSPSTDDDLTVRLERIATTLRSLSDEVAAVRDEVVLRGRR